MRCINDEVAGAEEGRGRHAQEVVALNSSTGGAGPLPLITTPLIAPINVVSTTIDTRELAKRGVSRVKILLVFTATINLPAGVLVTLNFDLVRSNSGTTTPVGPSFTFAETVAILESEAFAFQFFDTDLVPDSYTYAVQLDPTSVIAITPGVSITNATLSAIAVIDG